MTHEAQCCRRDGNLRTYYNVRLNYDENTCSGKEGCIVNCGFQVLGDTEA